MKVYSGTRVFDPESVTHGEASVVVQNVGDDGPSERRPLTHVAYHSPDGFEWGYAGSGPADLALAILADYFDEPPEFVLAALRSMWTPRSKAAALHQSFKEGFVATEHRDEWQLHSDEIAAWLQTPTSRRGWLSWPRRKRSWRRSAGWKRRRNVPTPALLTKELERTLPPVKSGDNVAPGY